MKNKKRDYLLFQLLIGLIITVYGLYRLFFREPTFGFNLKYFQPTINSGAIALLIRLYIE